MFQEDATEKRKTHIGTEYFARIYPKEEQSQWNQWKTTSTEKLKGKYWDTDT